MIFLKKKHTHSSEHVKMDVPQELDNIDQSLYDNKYSEFDCELDGIIDQEYHHMETISTASDTSQCIM